MAVYDVQFENRLLGVALGAPILGLGNGIQNVGSVESRGFEAAAVWSFTDALRRSIFGMVQCYNALPQAVVDCQILVPSSELCR